jgi:hypothetical protein
MNEPMTASEWVTRNQTKLSKYAGQYVAITGKGIVATNSDFDTVYRKAREKGVINPLVFKVPTDSQRIKFVSVRVS